jgi:hypothetical protein
MDNGQQFMDGLIDAAKASGDMVIVTDIEDDFDEDDYEPPTCSNCLFIPCSNTGHFCASWERKPK